MTSNALVSGLKRRIEDLEVVAREKKELESKCRRLEATISHLKQTITADNDPLACVVCLESTTAVLPCAHRLCSSCVSSMGVDAMGKGNSYFNCPICKKEYCMDTNPKTIELVDKAAYSHKPWTALYAPFGVPKANADALRHYVSMYAKRVEHEKRYDKDLRKTPFRSWSAPSSPR